MTGEDIPLQDMHLILHQPKIKEISRIGEKAFLAAAQTICIDKKAHIKDENLLDRITNFQVFMSVIEEQQEIKTYVINLLSVLFPLYRIMMTPQSIILASSQDDNGNIIIDMSNFEILQPILRQVFCLDNLAGGSDTQYNPQGKKAQEIYEKIMKGRSKLAAEKGEDNSSALGRYMSILSIGDDSTSLLECNEMTLYQLYDQFERYTLYVNWDIDVRSRLAGGTPDSKPDNWMKNIH